MRVWYRANNMTPSGAWIRGPIEGVPDLLRHIVVAGLLAAFLPAVHPAAQSRDQSGPPVPFEDIGACPFEGCVYDDGWVANRNVSVRTERGAGAPVAFRLKRGEKITALTGVVVTVKAGRVLLHRPKELFVNRQRMVLKSGEVFYLLTYQGEGFTKIWYQGEIYTDVDVTSFDDEYCRRFPDRCNGKIVERSTTVWWIQVKNAAGKVGWTNEPQAFDRKDAIGR
jgi:hypothetical protein